MLQNFENLYRIHIEASLGARETSILIDEDILLLGPVFHKKNICSRKIFEIFKKNILRNLNKLYSEASGISRVCLDATFWVLLYGSLQRKPG